MGYAISDQKDTAPLAVKILIAGGFGVGKTTLVGAVSEVAPLRTEEYLTHASVGVDDLEGVGGKTTTTVALDFGRITLNRDIVLYLFGTPGQERFWFMWNDLVNGAMGADRPGRHPPAGGELRLDRLLREPRHPLHRRRQLLPRCQGPDAGGDPQGPRPRSAGAAGAL